MNIDCIWIQSTLGRELQTIFLQNSFAGCRNSSTYQILACGQKGFKKILLQLPLWCSKYPSKNPRPKWIHLESHPLNHSWMRTYHQIIELDTLKSISLLFHNQDGFQNLDSRIQNWAFSYKDFHALMRSKILNFNFQRITCGHVRACKALTDHC